MTLSGKRYAPREFLSVIDRIDDVTPLVLDGMVKADAQDPDALLFVPGRSCERWVRVPLTMVESVEPLGQVSCGDHRHPLVRLVFAAPETPEAAAYAALAATTEALAQTVVSALAAGRLQVEAPDGGTDGGTVDPCKKCENDCKDKHPGNALLRWACRLEKCPQC